MSDEKLLETTLRTWPLTVKPTRYGVFNGIVWAVAPGAVGLNGYISVPTRGHLWSNGFPNNLNEYLSVHGGVTFNRHPWLGFDTCHLGDTWDAGYDPHGLSHPVNGGIDWTLDAVILETMALAEQVTAIR